MSRNNNAMCMAAFQAGMAIGREAALCSMAQPQYAQLGPMGPAGQRRLQIMDSGNDDNGNNGNSGYSINRNNGNNGNSGYSIGGGAVAPYRNGQAPEEPQAGKSSATLLERQGYQIMPVGEPTGRPQHPCKIERFETRCVYAVHPETKEMYLLPNFETVAVTTDGQKFSERDMK